MNDRNDKSGSDIPYRRHIMKIDLTEFHKRDFKYDHTLYGKITIDDGGSQREIEAEIRPDINGTIYESSKDAVLKNRSVTGNYSNFSLSPGANQIACDGNISDITISNYSRFL